MFPRKRYSQRDSRKSHPDHSFSDHTAPGFGKCEPASPLTFQLCPRLLSYAGGDTVDPLLTHKDAALAIIKQQYHMLVEPQRSFVDSTYILYPSSRLPPPNRDQSTCHVAHPSLRSQQIKLRSRIPRILHIKPNPHIINVPPRLRRNRIYARPQTEYQ